MGVRSIVLYPDPVLLRPTRPVERVDDRIRALVRDMADTMYDAPGVGLAANQIGATERVFIVDLSVGEEPDGLRVFINPVIRSMSGSQTGEEGCLSFPDITLDIERPETVTVEALDLDGEPFVLTADGLMARAITHESEHLDGQTFLRNVSPVKRELVKRQIKKRMKSGDWMASAAG